MVSELNSSQEGLRAPVEDFPIYVINLERSRDRREVMREHLTSLGLRFEFITAVDGAALNPTQATLYSASAAQETIGRELLPGEIGCALSHYDIYRQMVEGGTEVALIIEDDVALSKDLLEVLRVAAESNFEWDLVNLITDVDEVIREDELVASPYRLTHFNEMPNRTGAYLLRLSGAQKLLSSALPVRMAADTLTGDFHGSGLILRGIFPPLATLLPFKSTFQRGNYPPKSIVWARKVPSDKADNIVTLNPELIPSHAWVVWHTIRSYLGPLKRALLRLIGSSAFGKR